MKSFLPPNCLKGGMCLLHLKKATMHTVKQLLQPHLARRVQPTIKSSRTCPTLSQVPRSQRQPHVSQRLNLVYAICVMSQFPENVTLLLSNRCHVMLAEQPSTFGVPSWLEFLGMVHGFVKVVP